jgi:hypothetical protein
MTKNAIRVTDYCWIEPGERGILVGDDLHMNGLDSPARLATADIPTLVAALIGPAVVERMRRRVFNYANEDYENDQSCAMDIMEDFLKMFGSDTPAP